MKRKIVVVCSSVVFLFSVAGCTAQAPQQTVTPQITQQTTEPSPSAEATPPTESTPTEEATVQPTEDIHDPAAAITDPKVALEYLKEGNERYVDNQGIHRTTDETDRAILKDGQKPFAVIVTCSDSRVAPELYFDQKLGDIFVIRNAGNISDPATLGSIEYAVEHLKSPLVVVVGHSKCGAVTAAVQGGEYPENLKFVVDTIKDSIGDDKDVDTAIHDNVDHVVDTIKADKVINNGKTTIVGAYYDIVSGKVAFEE